MNGLNQLENYLPTPPTTHPTIRGVLFDPVFPGGTLADEVGADAEAEGEELAEVVGAVFGSGVVVVVVVVVLGTTGADDEGGGTILDGGDGRAAEEEGCKVDKDVLEVGGRGFEDGGLGEGTGGFEEGVGGTTVGFSELAVGGSGTTTICA